MSVGHELDSTHAVSDAERAVAAWAEHNGCGAESTDTQVRERVVRSDYDQCGPGAVVAMIINEYSWGGDTAERTLWEFFDSLP
jgi:poly(3-hydroxybutyrate) depolymerase